jgi:hypothetical protein
MTPSDPSIAARRLQAERVAKEKTDYLDPHTFKQVRAAINRRVDVLIEELKRRVVGLRSSKAVE